MNYSEIRSRLITGDLVLFSGKSRISNAVKWSTWSRWSHVGMVYAIPEHDLVLLWESSTLDDLEDLETGRANQGVQLVSLGERLRRYVGEVAVRLLKVERTQSRLTALNKLRREFAGRPYEAKQIELIKAVWDGPGGKNRENLSSLFCSEMIAEAYRCMELLPSGAGSKPSNEYTPADFSEAGNLQLLEGFLTVEIPILPDRHGS